MADGRAIPKLTPPRDRGGRHFTCYLDPEDYRVFYEVVMARGVSGAEAFRQLIREEGERCSNGS